MSAPTNDSKTIDDLERWNELYGDRNNSCEYNPQLREKLASDMIFDAIDFLHG
jgi:hypothetical protein